MKRFFRGWIGPGVTGLAIAFFLASSGPDRLTTAEAASLPGTATVSGTVDSPKPFQAAQVYLRNAEKRMLYMVYTSGGRFQAMHLFPGNYELSVKAKGLQSDVTKLTLKAGQNATANVSLHESTASDLKKDVQYLTYREIYPPGPGLAIAERTCIYCHGQDFLPSKHWEAKQWNEAIDYMTGKNSAQGAMIQPKDMPPQDREVLVQYLVKNFGPGSAPRAVKIETDMPVAEAKVAKAMYIEYYLPTDPPGQGVNSSEYAEVAGFARGRRMGQDIQLDKDGNVWLTDRGFPNRLCKLDPRTGAYKEFLMPNPKAAVHDLNIDKNGIVWVPENEGVPAGQPKLQAFDPKTEKWIGAYPFDPQNVISADILKHAHSIDFDSKGNVFVGFILGNGLSRLDRETKKMSTYTLPTPNSFPYGVVVDKNDNVWIAEFHGSKIAKFDPKTGKFTEYNPPTQPALIRRLTVGSDGTTIWFGLFSAGKLDKLDPATGKITEYKIPHQVSEPYDFAPEGKYIWMSDAGQGGALIKFNPDDQSFTYFPAPQRADMPKIRVTKEGSIWYSPRSSRDFPGIGVLHPDMTKITTLAALPRS